MKGTPVWNKETIAKQQIMNEHLADFRRDFRRKDFNSNEEAKKVVVKQNNNQ
jgi:hypothetical protein